ncbi:MAG TPA: TonB-dependent receptor [Pyrinomonadaceae bacterium]
MASFLKKQLPRTFMLLALLVSASAVFAQQTSAVLRGHVTDEFDARIIGATVTVVTPDGAEKTCPTDNDGSFVFPRLTPGKYIVRATMPGFADFADTNVEVTRDGQPLNIRMSVALIAESVEAASESAIGVEAENNANALVLRDKELDVLPDDPDQLAAALLALAGPPAGPNGGQIFIDGFTGGRLPPKESIREIRINKNPFAAEFDRLGYGRVEVLTKPGSEARLRGQAFANFSDESLNSRHSFAANRAPYQYRFFGGSVSGPVIPNRASFFFDFQRRETDNNAVVNATILDSEFNVMRLSQAVLTPERYTTFSPRFDYQINAAHTLTARYSFTRWDARNRGVGDFSLPSRAYDSSRTEQMAQLSETTIINQSMINEARFQYVRSRQQQEGDNSIPTISVLDAFTGGGSQIGISRNNADRLELQDSVSWVRGQHALKAGGRWRFARIEDVSRSNFGGTFTFTSLEQYRQTLLGLPGSSPAQFSIAAGDPAARVSQWDFGAFLQDDWRVRPNLMLSLGLRYERQNNIYSNYNFAPRLAFAWSPWSDGSRQPKTVVRGGFGIFYERFNEDLSLQAARFNGTTQQQYIVSQSVPGGLEVLGLFPNVPPAETLSRFAAAQTTRRVATDLQSPYIMQSVISVEHQLPFKITLTATFINSRMHHVLRSRNVGDGGNIFQFESSGVFKQNQLILNANNNFNKHLSLFASYVLNKAGSDTDGAYSFPANSYDLGGEYGRSSLDIRHRFLLGGFVKTLWEINLTPFISASSGGPFNITTGRDANGDTLFTERPAFATDLSKPGVIVTPFGAFDPNPTGEQKIIPRNFGQGPGFFAVNLGINRTFKFGEMPASSSGKSDKNNPLGSLLNKVGSAEKRFELTLSVRVQNLLNHTNASTPIGNLNSPLFGQSTQSVGAYGSGISTGGNRRIDAQIRLSF